MSQLTKEDERTQQRVARKTHDTRASIIDCIDARPPSPASMRSATAKRAWAAAWLKTRPRTSSLATSHHRHITRDERMAVLSYIGHVVRLLLHLLLLIGLVHAQRGHLPGGGRHGRARRLPSARERLWLAGWHIRYVSIRNGVTEGSGNGVSVTFLWHRFL